MLSLSYVELLDIQQRASNKIEDLVNSLNLLDKSLKNISDQDLEKMFISAGSDDPIADREMFRIWQSTVKGFADNYAGLGELNDKAAIIQKCIKPNI